MLSSLKKLLSPPPCRDEAHRAYVTLVAQARRPEFYESCGVADTLDGRFDAIVLHMFLLIHRLKSDPHPTPLPVREREAKATPERVRVNEFTRVLQEAFFYDMDRSLREMGSTDTGVGKRVKAMAQAFYGRLQAYEKGLADAGALKEALARNLYRGDTPGDEALEAAATYVTRNLAHLDAQDTAKITSGEISFLS